MGGYVKGGNVRDTRFGYKSLRMNRPLLENMVITVEPGCYFIEYLLKEAQENDDMNKFINNERLNDFRSFGGIRLEDSLVITKTGVLNLTTCPRTTDDVIAVYNGTITDKKLLTPLF